MWEFCANTESALLQTHNENTIVLAVEITLGVKW